mgnify:FL=1
MKIKRFEFNMFPVNCYVISDETGEAAIIDAGCFFPEEQQMLKQYIADNKLTVKHLLNTHLHLDHVFGNPFILREFGLKAEACQLDEFLLAKLPDQCRMFGFSPNEAPVGLGHYIEDGEIIRFGHTELQAIHVLGHSPGGMVYYCKADACLFSGDVLFQGSIGRADLEGGDFNELIEQISCRLLTLPDETLVYPGHGEPTSIGKEKMENPFFK